MADPGLFRRALPAGVAIAFLAGCGNTGDLYLPEARTTGEVVTRPAPAPDATGGADSPQTADSPVVPPTPAPEVTDPEPEEEDKDSAAEPRQ